MKNLLFAGLIITAIVCSCTKTNEVPDEQVTTSEQSDLSQQQLTKTLTAHKWMYQEFYSHYVDEQHKGQRFYDRDSTNNFDEYLADVVFTFYKTHRFTKYVSPYTYHGTWNFSDSKPTYLTLKFSYETEKDSVVLFDINHLNYFKKEAYSHWYTSLVPLK